MKFNKLDKQKILIVSILVFVFLNLTVVYKPLKDKYQRQKNQLKIIKNLEKEKLEKKKDKIKEENIIISLESHFRENLNINYTYDGLHVNEKGYLIVSEELKKYII